MSHALERTSPKGGPFFGTCIKCGQSGLRMGDALKDCPADDLMSNEAALVQLIDPRPCKDGGTGMTVPTLDESRAFMGREPSLGGSIYRSYRNGTAQEREWSRHLRARIEGETAAWEMWCKRGDELVTVRRKLLMAKAERDAARAEGWKAGAEAMRERAAEDALSTSHEGEYVARSIRALALPHDPC